jgi:hypothetical protein
MALLHQALNGDHDTKNGQPQQQLLSCALVNGSTLARPPGDR